jgi:hypothetical protein
MSIVQNIAFAKATAIGGRGSSAGQSAGFIILRSGVQASPTLPTKEPLSVFDWRGFCFSGSYVIELILLITYHHDLSQFSVRYAHYDRI